MFARMAVNFQRELEVSESRYLKLSLTKEGPNGNKILVNKHIKEAYAGMLEQITIGVLIQNLPRTNSECV